jgi:hypothetical protein
MTFALAAPFGRRSTMRCSTFCRSPLAAIAQLVGTKKIELRLGEIERMDPLQKNEPERFEKYAVQDAVIAAKYCLSVWSFSQDQLGIGADLPPTLGSAAIRLFDWASWPKSTASAGRPSSASRSGRLRYGRARLRVQRPWAAPCRVGSMRRRPRGAEQSWPSPSNGCLNDLPIRGWIDGKVTTLVAGDDERDTRHNHRPEGSTAMPQRGPGEGGAPLCVCSSSPFDVAAPHVWRLRAQMTTGIDDLLKLEAVYLSGAIPRTQPC